MTKKDIVPTVTEELTKYNIDKDFSKKINDGLFKIDWLDQKLISFLKQKNKVAMPFT